MKDRLEQALIGGDAGIFIAELLPWARVMRR
jgi:hypothetical protein